MTQTDKRCRYRSREQATIIGLFGYGLGTVISLMAVAPDLAAPDAVVGGALCVSLCVIFGTWRAVRAAIIVESEGVIVRNPLGTKRFPWSMIDRFEGAETSRAYRIVRIQLKDGTSADAWAVQSPNPWFRPNNPLVENVVDALSAHLNHARRCSSQDLERSTTGPTSDARVVTALLIGALPSARSSSAASRRAAAQRSEAHREAGRARIRHGFARRDGARTGIVGARPVCSRGAKFPLRQSRPTRCPTWPQWGPLRVICAL
jgi:hypothetical protein